MKKLLITLMLFISWAANSGEHSLAAHEHGSIKLGMAIEKNIIDIDLDGPSEAFISFEYLPKTEREKKVFNDVKNLWEKNLFELISFDKKLNCRILEATLTQVIDQKESGKKESGTHSEIEAKAKISCAGNLAGTEVQVSLKKHFKNIKRLVAEILGTDTKSVEITKPVQSFKI